MRLRFLLPSFAVWLFVAPALSGQLSSDPTTNRLAIIDHVAAFTQSDVKNLSSRAESGEPEAQYWLGHIYREGRLVTKNDTRAESLFLQSAEKGYGPAQFVVAMMSFPGDPPRAETWLLRAAEQGNAEAQFWLGTAYEDRWFGTTDLQEAVEWYQKSAEQGHPDAQATLGRMFENGDGVKQNYVVAAEWYRKAAEHVPDLGGAGQGRNQLGLLYLEGLGVPKDYVQAYMWFSIGHSSENLKYVQSQMTPEQILAGQRMAADWESRQLITH